MLGLPVREKVKIYYWKWDVREGREGKGEFWRRGKRVER